MLRLVNTGNAGNTKSGILILGFLIGTTSYGHLGAGGTRATHVDLLDNQQVYVHSHSEDFLVL